jgi:hypothetical protein
MNKSQVEIFMLMVREGVFICIAAAEYCAFVDNNQRMCA